MYLAYLPVGSPNAATIAAMWGTSSVGSSLPHLSPIVKSTAVWIVALYFDLAVHTGKLDLVFGEG